MTRRAFVLIASALIFLLFIAANAVLSRWLAPLRIDLTGNQLYTLSESAEQVLSRLVEPVELEFVYSRAAASEFPGLQSHAARIRELLGEISAQSDGKVVIRQTFPEEYSEDEDRVALAGLTSLGDGGAPMFLGVIGRNTVDDEIIIPALTPARDAFLEYDLIRLIAQLDDPAPPVIALLSGLPGFQGDGRREGDAFILREMARQFQVRVLTPDFDELPADADILMLVNPPALDDERQAMIDRFMRTKGRAFVALDPASRVAAASGAPTVASQAGQLGQTLGFRMLTTTVADPVIALPVEIDAGGGRTNILGQPLFLGVPRALMASTDPVTGDLTRPINLGAAGALEFDEASGLTVEPLMESSDEAMVVSSDLAVTGPGPVRVFEAMSPPAGARILAARISGRLGPATEAGERLQLSDLEESDGVVSDVIVVADSDFLADGFHLDPSAGAPVADNAAFVLNALDNLAGGAALSSLRSRAPALRPMTTIDEIRREAESRYYAEQTELQEQLEQYEARLAEIESNEASFLDAGRDRSRSGDAEAEELRTQILETRTRLRGIERNFRADLDRVETTLVAANVWLLPALVAIAGLGVFVWRSRRRAGRP